MERVYDCDGPERTSLNILESIRSSLERCAVGAVSMLRPVRGSLVAQFHMTRRNVEDTRPIWVMPVYTLIFMAVFAYVDREDLAAYSLVAPTLMTVGQMGFFVASELMSRERYNQTLEIVVATPTPLWLIILTRISVLTSMSLLGLVISWAIIRVVFGVTVAVYHPVLFAVAMVVTALSAAGSTLITTALFSMARTARTYQNSIIFPLFLLGGIMVPITEFPAWIQPLSRLIYLYWSANLLRDSMSPETPVGAGASLAAVAALGIAGAVIGALMILRMLDKLRREGRLGVL